MLIKGLLLSSLIILFGFITVSGLILTIIKRNIRRARSIWLLVTIISFLLAGVIAVYAASKVIKNTFERSSELKETVINTAMEGLTEALEDNRKDQLDTGNRQIELLKSYAPDDLNRNIPPSFYTYLGFRDWYRFPLVYPYSLNCIDSPDYGYISDERNAIDITYSTEGAEQLEVSGITRFTFDKKLLLAELSSPSDDSEKTYVLFRFSNHTTERFDSLDALMQKADEHGYTGSDTLITIREYNSQF